MSLRFLKKSGDRELKLPAARFIARHIDDLHEMNIPDVIIIPDDNNLYCLDVIIKDVHVTIKMPVNYPLNPPHLSYINENGKLQGYKVNDWNPAMGLKSVIWDFILSRESIQSETALLNQETPIPETGILDLMRLHI